PRRRGGSPADRRAAARGSAGRDPEPARGGGGDEGARALPRAASQDGAGRREALMVRIAVSMGDPLGIGPGVVAAALATPTMRSAAEIVVHGDARTLQRAAALRGVPLECEIVQIGSLEPDPGPREAGASALEYVRRAARACMEGRAGAVCTAPLSKQRVELGERGSVGH